MSEVGKTINSDYSTIIHISSDSWLDWCNPNIGILYGALILKRGFLWMLFYPPNFNKSFYNTDEINPVK